MNKKLKFFFTILISLILIGAIYPLSIQADDASVFSLDVKSPLQYHNLMELANSIVNILVWVAFAVLTISILYAGFMFIGSGGDTTKIKKAKDALVYTLVGLLIILFSKFIIAIIKGVFSGKV